MKNKKRLFIICLVIGILFTISSVHAGIFEFVEDTDDASDDAGPDDNYDIREFKVKISKSKSVQDKISEMKEDSNYEDDFDSFQTVAWLMDFEDYVIFTTADGDYLVVSESESDKLPTSHDYSY